MSKFEDAILDFTKEIEQNPKNDQAYYDRGLAEAKLSHYNSAIDDYSKAIELNPKNADYYADRGELLYRSGGDLKKAEQDLTKAIELDSTDAEKYLTRAMIFCKLKMYLVAIDDLNIAIKINPKNTEAYDLRSYAIKSLSGQGK